ncbi:hypothetical protein A9Q84_16310 [Halobacteriovorax marinus]|uniref:Cytochrome c domain-containing protein n=1 Tax=Halobacteriovorax marinus TaxID=97084 RepID=A0A1Y5F4B2_9BACT|nr:hypothetical protein A9Q84_16310 [Halobacteriovorax marinus]
MISLLLFLLTSKSFAYESMIVKNYNSCVACHRSPEGGGLLTTYGKVISSSTSLIKGTHKEGPFKKFINAKGKLDHAFYGRYAYIKTNGESRKFPMQGDYLGAFQATKNVEAVITIARAPKSQAISSGIENPSGSDLIFLRKAVLKVHSGSHNLIIGRDRQIQGLNIVDHTVLTKSLNRMNVSDLKTTAKYFYQGESSSFKSELFFPSGQEFEGNKEHGFASEYRKYLDDNLILGGVVLAGFGEVIKRKVVSSFFKKAISSFVLMGEYSYTYRELKLKETFDQRATLTQLSWFLNLHTEIFLRFESVRRNKYFELKEERQTVGMRMRVNPHITFQTDYKKTKRNDLEENLLISQLFFNVW